MLSPSKTIPKSPSFNSVSELHLVDAAWLEVSDAKNPGLDNFTLEPAEEEKADSDTSTSIMTIGELSREKKALTKELNCMTFARDITTPGMIVPSFVHDAQRALVNRMALISATMKERGAAIALDLDVMSVGELSREKKALTKELNAMTFARQLSSRGVQPVFMRDEERALASRIADVSAALKARAAKIVLDLDVMSVGELSREKKALTKELNGLVFARQLASRGVQPSCAHDEERTLVARIAEFSTALKARAAKIVVDVSEMSIGELSREIKTLTQELNVKTFVRQIMSRGAQPASSRDEERTLVARIAEVSAALTARGSEIVIDLEDMSVGELSREKKALTKELNAMTFARQLSSRGVQPAFTCDEERALVARIAEVSAALKIRGAAIKEKTVLGDMLRVARDNKKWVIGGALVAGAVAIAMKLRRRN